MVNEGCRSRDGDAAQLGPGQDVIATLAGGPAAGIDGDPR